MKKIISAICASALILTLSGCSKKDTLQIGGATPQSAFDTPAIPVDNPEDLELQKISELRGDIDRQVENIKNADYKNLHVLDNFTVTIPETDVLYELELTQKEYTWQEYYDAFDRAFDANFGDIYTEADKAELYYAIAAEDERSEEYGIKLIPLAERRDKFESGELHMQYLYVSTDKAYFEMWFERRGIGVYRMYHDGVKKRANFESDDDYYKYLSSIHVERLFKAVKETFDVDCDDRYELLDGEVSVNEAAEWVTQAVKEYGYTLGGDLEPRIYEYRVFDLKDGKYGLEFEFAPFYKGVMLDCGDVIYETYSMGHPDDLNRLNHEYYLEPAEALMFESGKIENFYGGNGAHNVAELEEYDSVIPLDKAVEIAAEKFGWGMNLALGSADLCYSETYFKDEEQTVKGAFPVWKLKLANSMDGWKYITYINATTGEMEYYLTEKWVL